MIVFNILYSMILNKCSRCHQGDVFVSKNPYDLSKMFKLHKSCTHCNLKYEKEPHFFYGALYISYGISAGWFIIWYSLLSVTFNWDNIHFILFLSLFIVAVAPLTLRWSRLIWLNIFYKYRKEFDSNSQKSNLKETQSLKSTNKEFSH